MSVRAIYSIGWIVLLSAAWLLVARTMGWDNAGFFNAAFFGLVLYAGFRFSPR